MTSRVWRASLFIYFWWWFLATVLNNLAKKIIWKIGDCCYGDWRATMDLYVFCCILSFLIIFWKNIYSTLRLNVSIPSCSSFFANQKINEATINRSRGYPDGTQLFVNLMLLLTIDKNFASLLCARMCLNYPS